MSRLEKLSGGSVPRREPLPNWVVLGREVAGRWPGLNRIFGSRPPLLPPVPLTHGPAVPGSVIRIVAAVLPAVLLGLAAIRLQSVFAPLALGVGLFGLALGIFALVRPFGGYALVAIGMTALFSLAFPPVLGWSLAWAALGYLAFRAGVLARDIPWSALVETEVLRRWVIGDLIVLGITALAGAIAFGVRQLTGCDFSGASIAPMSDVAAVARTCHPAGSGLVILGAIALTVLALGVGFRRGARKPRCSPPELAR